MASPGLGKPDNFNVALLLLFLLLADIIVFQPAAKCVYIYINICINTTRAQNTRERRSISRRVRAREQRFFSFFFCDGAADVRKSLLFFALMRSFSVKKKNKISLLSSRARYMGFLLLP